MSQQLEVRPQTDVAAVLTIVGVAALCLGGAWLLPWWTMEARAPQYGQRTLVVDVSPAGVHGDVFEVDTLGHYVGIRKMESFAPLERKLAPFGVAGAALCLLVLAFVKRRWLRLLLALPAAAMPIVFLADLGSTMRHAANDRDPEAPLNTILTEIDTRLFGEYVVAQFKVTAKPGAGLFLAGTAALLGAGLSLATPLLLGRRRRRRPLVGAGVAAAGLLLLVGPADAAEVQVRPGGSIAAAIAAAAEGDTVLIPAGIFHEHLTVDRRLTLQGAPGAIVDGGGEGTVLSITAAGSAVRGLQLQNSGDGYNREDAGIRIDHAARVSISDTVVRDSLFGIFVVQGDACVIERSMVSGKPVDVNRRGDGIRLWYSGGCRLSGNLVEDSRDLVIWYSKGTLVEENTVRRSRYGLHYMFSDDNTFRRNRFEDNQVGAAIMYSRRITLSENAFSFSSGPSAYGLLLKDCDDIFIRGNRFIGNDTAMFFDGAPQSRGGRVEVTANLLARNDVGVALQPSQEHVVFSGNSFLGDRTPVLVHGGGRADKNSWAGNFWSDAVLYDRDGDGVSDVPYVLETSYEVLADRIPELAFFAQTPAAEALDAAARLFPLFAPQPLLTDPAPLTRAPLSDWTATRGGAFDGRLALSGVSLLALAGALMGAARRVLA